MPTEGEILEDTGNLIDGINHAFTARQPVQDQLDAAQRDIQKWINSLGHQIVEVHARTITNYRHGQHPDQEGHDEPHRFMNVKMVMLVMEVVEAPPSQSMAPCLRLRGIQLGPRAGLFPWVQVWQHDITLLRLRPDVSEMLKGLEVSEPASK